MIIKLIETKATAREAPRYAELLAGYMGEADADQGARAGAFEQAPAVEHGLSLSRYMTHARDDDEGTTALDEVRVRVAARGALTRGHALSWEEALTNMRNRLDRKLAPGAKPVRHAVASLREGERFASAEQCEESCRVLLDELGCPNALALWALHTDTDNDHLHLMIVTVDPLAASTTAFGNRAGYKDAMQRAIARLDDAHGWQSEAGARYEMRNGQVTRRGAPPKRADRAPPIDNPILAWERESGLSSFTRMAQERAGPVLREARSWDEAHRALAAVGMAVRPKAGGGEIQAGDEHVKLTRVGRDLTWKRLTGERRLGRYAPPPPGLEIATYEPRVDDPQRFRQWLGRRHRNADLAARTERRVQALRSAREHAVAAVRIETDTLLAGLAPGAPAYVRAELRGRIRQARDLHIAGIRSVFDARIAAVRAIRDEATELPSHSGFDLEGFSAIDMAVMGAPADGAIEPRPLDLPGYRARQVGRTVQYWSGAGNARLPAFTDHGTQLFVNSLDPRTIETVLTLASERFGRVAVAGAPEFIAACRDTAARLHIPLDVAQPRGAALRRRLKDVGWRRLPEQAEAPAKDAQENAPSAMPDPPSRPRRIPRPPTRGLSR